MSRISKVKHQMPLSEWSVRIHDCQTSGLKLQEWCNQNGLNIKTYYYWLRKVRQAALGCTSPELVRLEDDSSSSDRMIRIRYGSAELNLPENVDLAAVAALLDTLRHG